MPLDHDDTRPLLALYVAWHPFCELAGAMARRLYDHFRRDLFTNVAGGVGLSVLYRSVPTTNRPDSIPLDDSHVTVVILILSQALVMDGAWREYVRDLLTAAATADLTVRVIPVCLDGYGINIVGSITALRYDAWAGSNEEREVRLISALTLELSAVLRTYIAANGAPRGDQLQVSLERVCVFLSHSKRDDYGERIAVAIKRFLSDDTALSQFFDVRDIPPGLSFPDVIERYVVKSAVVAIYTDSFSSREWCRREIIMAKRRERPLVIADCIHEIDERSFPYLGNVPVVRMEPRALERIPHVVARLLDEVFKDYLWCARLSHDGRTSDSKVRYLSRTPELIALSSIEIAAGPMPPTMVYPDPPLGAEELQLFIDVRPDLLLVPYSEFAAINGGAP